MTNAFAPGCALMLYKPHLVDKLHAILEKQLGKTDMLLTCCRHDPQVKTRTHVINICSGCDKRFRTLYENVSTISLWEVLATNDFFKFPDYNGQVMSIMDPCPARDQERIHQAIRILLDKMNIRLIEPAKTKSNSICCGEGFYGSTPVEQVISFMKKRAADMPVENVAVYCVSCIKSAHIGGKHPRYLIDLLFGEDTDPQTYDPDQWHKELDDYINQH
jgi:Fe-S oxidoreductase